MADRVYPILVTQAPKKSRPKQYQTHVEVIQQRLAYLKTKIQEWKKTHDGMTPGYFRKEQETLNWVLALATCVAPEEQPVNAPVPVLADECPKCRAATKRPADGRTRMYPWVCAACGHTYPPEPEEPTDSKSEGNS